MLLNISKLQKRIKRTVKPTLKLWVTRPLKVYNRTYNKSKVVLHKSRRLLNGVNKSKRLKSTLFKYMLFSSDCFSFYYNDFIIYR